MEGPPPEGRTAAPPGALRVLLRGLRTRCPACGDGRVFPHPLSSTLCFRGATRCEHCGWWLERGPGHWIGGAEINMIATFWVAVPLFLAWTLLFGFSSVMIAAAAVFTVAFQFLIYRPSRALFFALDYLIDPTLDPSEHGGADGDPRRDDRDPRSPRPPCPPSGPLRRRPPLDRVGAPLPAAPEPALPVT